MSHFIDLFRIAAWPVVAVLAMFLFGGAIRSFLRNATLTSVNMFGVEIKTTIIRELN